MRNAGANRLRAYQRSLYISLRVRGFHRSRIIDGGFPCHSLKEWQQARETWRRDNPTGHQQLEEIVARLRQSSDTMIEVLAGRIPDRETKAES